ncbi:MAG: NlpC/P60 family protein, partial [Paraprevotella sp.]|nr:NlpC/P60 family protein [Paraprevotella sp.]
MMRILWTLLMVCGFYGASASGRLALPEEVTDTVKGQAIVEKAKEFLGVPYRYGQMNPKSGFDCFGFTTYVYKSLNISLTHSSRSQFTEGLKIEDRHDLQQGDQVFFTGSRSRHTVGHVGIVTEVDEDTGTFKFIHAARNG